MTEWRLAVEPRSWQSAAFEQWKKGLRGVVSVVTGAGKTAFAQMCMLEFRLRYPTGRFLIVVPTTALLDQWYVSLEEDLGVLPDEITTYSGEHRSTAPGVVSLLVINTARDWIARATTD